MLSDAEILSWAALTNYAYISVSPTCVIRPGRECWERRLQQLTPDERAALVTKIARQEARLLAERDANRQSIALQDLAKTGSNSAPRGQDRAARSTTTGRRPAARRPSDH